MSFSCPHCGIIQITTAGSIKELEAVCGVGEFREGEEGYRAFRLGGTVVRCANPECERVTVRVALGSAYRDGSGNLHVSDPFLDEQIYPGPSGKPFPSGVPDFLLEDYREAWAIINLSPKSSATLARRCLQTMIRDFCKIKLRTLDQEITELEKQLKDDKLPRGVEPETIAAMQALRKLGNLGAHMTEVDGKIVDVDPGEAEALLGLIEMLFADWYVARERRQKTLAEIEAIGERKTPAPSHAKPAAELPPALPSPHSARTLDEPPPIAD